MSVDVCMVMCVSVYRERVRRGSLGKSIDHSFEIIVFIIYLFSIYSNKPGRFLTKNRGVFNTKSSI